MGLEFNDFAVANPKKLFLFLRPDNETWQEGGQAGSIFITLTPTWGFDTWQMTANILNQRSFLDPLASLLSAFQPKEEKALGRP